jgi:hypothetical protein
MSDPEMKHLVSNADRTKSIEIVQATTSDNSRLPLHPTTSVTRRKRRYLLLIIAFILLGAIAVIVLVRRQMFTHWCEGFGAALCAVACGVFIVRHVILELTDEDKLQEEQLNANQATFSPPESNPADREKNPTIPTSGE